MRCITDIQTTQRVDDLLEGKINYLIVGIQSNIQTNEICLVSNDQFRYSTEDSITKKYIVTFVDTCIGNNLKIVSLKPVTTDKNGKDIIENEF